ncbi:MAG: hypothetical protein EOT04_02825 [Candidatus Chaera renei]|uniref:Dephospho-CoA kinase n=1 Tax=Candidatus Chaera renei TaxID=2506947 RepID=A0A4Q0AGK5_9BACT|nr:MAG: hypothetical protein EOT04_02825 [Candidatus Chaera renei]
MMNSPNNEQLVLGLVGNAASGKDFVATFFAARGFVHFSTSELVRQEIYRRGLTPSRPLQTAIANELRTANGPAYFVEESLRQVNATLQRPDRVLLSGLYAVSEGQYITKELGGLLVGVVAREEDDVRLRFDRLSSRLDGSRDDLTLEEFKDAHHRENSGGTSEANVGQLMKLARFTIINDAYTTAAALDGQVQLILESMEQL